MVITPVRKAIFPVAGLGTRFLPATKAMPKELLPIIDKPIIQYAVEEAIEAGCTELIFVTGRTKRAIEDHFDGNPELVSALRRKGKPDIADMIDEIIPPHVNVIFIRQKAALGLGDAVRCASAAVGNEPALILLADDYILPEKGFKNPCEQLVAAYSIHGGCHVCAMPVPEEHISRYGIIDANSADQRVVNIVEKPTVAQAPSNLAAIGRYLIEPSIMKRLNNLLPKRDGEIQLTDALDAAAKDNALRYVIFSGRRFDCGDKMGYLEAIFYSAIQNPNYAEAFTKLINSAVSKQLDVAKNEDL